MTPESLLSRIAGVLSRPFWLEWHAFACEHGVWSQGVFQFYRRNAWGWWIPYPPTDGRI